MNPGPRVRVLYVVGNFVAGGAERHLLELWSRIDRDRFEVRIACFRREGQFADAVARLGWPVVELGVGRRIYDPQGLRGLLRLIHHTFAFKPDVIHGYLFGPNLFAVLAGRLCRVRAVVVAKRNVDTFESPRQAWLQSLAHRWATHVTAVSETVADTVVKLGVRRERVIVIPNGVDAERFVHAPPGDARARLGLNGGDPLIGSVGCLAARKDYATLLEALALLAGRGRAFQAALVGDGPERAPLEARAHELGIAGRVHFLGERSDVERLLPAMHVFVLSSREEGIPNALLEAMAAGRAAVATAVGGTPEVMQDGETGWMVPPGNPERLAAAIEAALADPAEAERRGRNAQRHAREALSIEAMVQRHEDAYWSLAGKEAA
ncbi:MAG TPA: glycosyltransferase [Candidatus Limnocylindria bacterium]|nr:glycosyltransferase [Candidatus Limnocylindria bacterium]